MSASKSSVRLHSHNLQSTTEIATKLLLVSTLAAIAFCLFSTPTYAQALGLGQLTVTTSVPCPPGAGWYRYTNNNTSYSMTCVLATVSLCSNAQGNVQDWGVTDSYLSPVGVLNGFTNLYPNGVIFIHGGGPGTSPGNFDFADNYFKAGYEVVEVAWSDDWEKTYDPFGSHTANIQAAACRPATLLNYVYNNIYLPIYNPPNGNSRAGMCAHADSAGSAAIAYSMAYYGANSYLDNVELTSGPVLSDIEQGCAEGPGAAQPVTVCGQTNYNGGQYGCQLGNGGSTWALSPLYLQGANTAVGGWTNDATCAAGLSTTGTSNAKWLAQSIVDQGTGATPTFTYGSTAVSGWLCRSVKNDGHPPYDCAGHNNDNPNFCPNNSSPQGQIFYANIGSSNQPPNYAVYAVDNCGNAEGVPTGNVPGYMPAIFNGNVTGINAVTYDMVGSGPPLNISAQCVHRNHQ